MQFDIKILGRKKKRKKKTTCSRKLNTKHNSDTTCILRQQIFHAIVINALEGNVLFKKYSYNIQPRIMKLLILLNNGMSN